MFCGINSCNVFECCLSALTQAHNPLVYCPVDDKLFEVGQKSAVQVCQITTVVMETTQLVPSQFKNFLLQ